MGIPELDAERRTGIGSTACRRLRDEGRIPGVVYGHKKETVPVLLPGEALEGALRGGARTLNLKIDGETEQVVLKEVQHDALGEKVLHVDFARVSRDEIITLDVALRLQGIAKGVKDGGMLDQRMQEVEVQCSAGAIPERISIRVDELGLEETMRLRDVPFPEGVRPTEDPESVVVTIRPPEEEEEAPAEPVEAMQEPEVITAREKKEEEET